MVCWGRFLSNNSCQNALGVYSQFSEGDSFAALRRAIAEGNAKKVRTLIESGFAVDREDYLGDSPLMDAVRRGNKEVVETLISLGADVNKEDSIKSTPLTLAIRSEKVEIMKALLAHHASVDVEDVVGGLLLMNALATEKVEELVQILLEAGVDINKRDKHRQTALEKAMRDWNLEAVRVLIKAGADLNVADSRGVLPIELADRIGQYEIANMLAERGAQIPGHLKEKYGPVQKRAHNWARIAMVVSSVRATRGNWFYEGILDLMSDIFQLAYGVYIPRNRQNDHAAPLSERVVVCKRRVGTPKGLYRLLQEKAEFLYRNPKKQRTRRV